MIRSAAEMPVSRFCRIIGIPRRTYHRRLALARYGSAEEQAVSYLLLSRDARLRLGQVAAELRRDPRTQPPRVSARRRPERLLPA